LAGIQQELSCADSRAPVGRPLRPEFHTALVSEQKPMKIIIRPRLNAEMVEEARRLGLDLSRIVDEALIKEIEAERRRRQADRDEDEGGNGTGSSTSET